MQEVANRAGVSKTAVSYVLNDHPKARQMTAATTERILRAAQELKFRPNALARGLANRRIEAVRLVPQDSLWISVWSGFVSEMMQGLMEVALAENYDLTLHVKRPMALQDEIAAVTDNRADGAVLWRHREDPLIGDLAQRNFPFVAIFGQYADPDVWYVDCDNVAGGRLATEYLLGLGHKRILHLTGDSRNSSVAGRRTGYEQAMEMSSAGVQRGWTVEVGWEGEGVEAYREVYEILRSPHPPTAVFCWYDGVARRVLKIAEELGLRVPQDLSIIGFDAIETGPLDARLTSMRQPVRQIASCAMDLLLCRLRAQEVPQSQILWQPALVERSSCSPPLR